MFDADDKVHLRLAMRQAGLPELRFRFDFEGTNLVRREPSGTPMRILLVDTTLYRPTTPLFLDAIAASGNPTGSSTRERSWPGSSTP